MTLQDIANMKARLHGFAARHRNASGAALVQCCHAQYSLTRAFHCKSEAGRKRNVSDALASFRSAVRNL